MYGYESWTIKKAERWITDVFELWCWRRLLRVLWTARRTTQSILKEISPNIHWKDWCWNWNANTLATWCKGLTHWKRSWCWERLKAGGEGDDRGWDGWMALLTQRTWVWVSSGSWWWTGKAGVLQSMESQRVRHNWATELKPEDGEVNSKVRLCSGVGRRKRYIDSNESGKILQLQQRRPVDIWGHTMFKDSWRFWELQFLPCYSQLCFQTQGL